jgi:hypothetical protein
METKLFTFIAKLNRDLYIYYKDLEVTNSSFNTRSQGDVIKYPTAPIVFSWCYKWEEPKINHEITFEIWKDKNWRLRSEHNTDEYYYDPENPLKGEFLFDYSFETLNDMINNIEKTKEEFFEIFQKRINL